MQSPKPILLVEDDRIDAMAVQRIARELKIPNQLVLKTDGEEALEYLKNDTARPCVILLDINMPKMNGIELLKIIRADDTLKNIPVVFVLSLKEDVERVKNLGAAYISKPVSRNNLSEILKAVGLNITSGEFSNNKSLGDTLVCKKE